MKPIISVKEARKLLGKKYEKMTEEQVVKLIDETHEFAKLALEVARQRRISKVRYTKAEGSHYEGNGRSKLVYIKSEQRET